MNTNLPDELAELSNQFKIAMANLEQEQERYWNSLSADEQLKAFCAVVRRIHKGEIEDQGTYRHVLYDVFNFGPDSYAPAQVAGYLNLHNSIINEEDLLRDFAKYAEVDSDLVSKFLQKKYF